MVARSLTEQNLPGAYHQSEQREELTIQGHWRHRSRKKDGRPSKFQPWQLRRNRAPGAARPGPADGALKKFEQTPITQTGETHITPSKNEQFD